MAYELTRVSHRNRHWIPETQGVGAIVPDDLDGKQEDEFRQWLGDDVILSATRTPYLNMTVSTEMVRRVSDPKELKDATLRLKGANLPVTMFCCTSASFVDDPVRNENGLAHEESCRQAMIDGGAHTALTTSGTILDALRFLDAMCITLVAPYTLELTKLFIEFLAEGGIETISYKEMGRESEIYHITEQELYEHVCATYSPVSEAVVLPCTNLPTQDLIVPLEQRLRVPAISAHEAMVWAARKVLGLPAPQTDELLFNM